MASKWIVGTQGVPVCGSALLAVVEATSGAATPAYLVATTIAVVTSSLCIGSQLFDQVHTGGESNVTGAD